MHPLKVGTIGDRSEELKTWPTDMGENAESVMSLGKVSGLPRGKNPASTDYIGLDYVPATAE